MWKSRAVLLLAVLFPAFSFGVTLSSELGTALTGLRDATTVQVDHTGAALWVGGAVDPLGTSGMIVWVDASTRAATTVSSTLGGPVLCSAKFMSTAYFGLQNGDIVEVNMATRIISRILPAPVNHSAVGALSVDPVAGAFLLKAFRFADAGSSLWCRNQIFDLPAYSARSASQSAFPNTCISNDLDVPGDRAYFAYQPFSCCLPSTCCAPFRASRSGLNR